MKSIIPWNRSGNSAIERMENLFDRFLKEPFRNWPPTPSLFSSKTPSVDVSEDKKEIIVRAEIPGLEKEDLDLNYSNGMLRISGEKKEEKEEKKKDVYFQECRYGYFSRDIPVGENVQWENADAKYNKGVLTVKLPKKAVKEKKVEIKVQ